MTKATSSTVLPPVKLPTMESAIKLAPRKQIRKQIESCLSEKWPYERVSKVNIVILQIAIFEMLYLKTPYKVVINEAVELAKAFGDTKSPSFVNGVLATIVKNNQLDNKGETEE